MSSKIFSDGPTCVENFPESAQSAWSGHFKHWSRFRRILQDNGHCQCVNCGFCQSSEIAISENFKDLRKGSQTAPKRGDEPQLGLVAVACDLDAPRCSSPVRPENGRSVRRYRCGPHAKCILSAFGRFGWVRTRRQNKCSSEF